MKQILAIIIFLISFHCFSQDWESFYTGNKVSSLEISDLILWIDTESSLVKMDLSSGDFKFHNCFDSVFVSQHFSQNPYISLSVVRGSEAFVGNGDNGLYQYINSQWIRIDSTISNLPSNSFLTLKGDYQGYLWFKNGHNHLVKYFESDSILTYESADHHIQDYVIDTLGDPWIKTEIGVVHMIEDSTILYDTTNTPWIHNSPYAVVIDRENALWVLDTLNRPNYTSSTYLFKYDGNNWTEFSSDSGQIPFEYFPWLIVPGPSNKLWFVFSDKILLFDSNQWDTIQFSKSYSVTDIAIKSEEDFHLGVFPLGLLSYQSGNEDIRPIANNSIPGEDVKSIAVEESGKVWVSAHALGGTSSGVSSYDKGVWSTNSRALNDMPGGPNSLCNLFWVSNQRLWALEAFEPAFLLDNGVWSEIEDPFDRQGIHKMAEDSKNSQWFLTSFSIGQIENGSYNIKYELDGGHYNNAFCIDHNDVIWAGDYFRLYRCENGVVETMTCNNSEIPCAPGFNDMAVDKDNVVWMCGPGILKYHNGIFTQYSIKKDPYISSDLVYSVAIDKDNVKYFGTYKGGVVRYDGQTWSSANRSNSRINHNSVSSIAVDNSNVWAGTYDGLFRFSKEIKGKIIEPLETVLTNIEIPSTNAKEINVYPNPANDLVYVSAPDNMTVLDVSIIGLDGLIYNSCFRSSAISVAGIKPGIYVLKIKFKNEVYYKKIMINAS